MMAPSGVIPPGGSTTGGVSSLVGQLVGSATTPTEITAAMLATLAGSSGLSEQRKVLIQLTEKVEEQKRAIQQQMQLTQQTNAPKAGGSTVAPSRESKMAPTSRVEPVTVAVPTPAVSLAQPVPSIPLPLVTPHLYMPKSEPSLNVVTKPSVANRNLTSDNKLPPVSSSKVSAASAQPLGSLPLGSLPAETKKVPGVIPNVARKRLAEKTGVIPPTTTGATPLSRNLSLLPPSVQMLLMGGPVQTPDSGSDKTQESKPTPDSSSPSANVMSPVVGGTARPVDGVEAPTQDKASDKVSIKPTSTGPTQTTTATSTEAASNANTMSDPERTLRQSDVDPVVLNPHGDVDYRIAPTGRFTAPPPGPPASDPQSSWQPAFQTKPQEVSTSAAGPKCEWIPALPASVPQKQPDWAPAVPAVKPAWEPAFPTEASRPADPRQRAAEERMRNAAFPPNAGRSEGPRQDEGGVRPLMWNARPPMQGRPPVPGPWGGAPPHPRFGAMPHPPLPPMRMRIPPPPPSIPNAAPLPSGDIDERIRPPWPPGGVTCPWPSEVRPPLPPPDNAERHKPAALLSVDLSALGKFAVEFVKEQQQKGQGIIPPITSCSTAMVPPPANALGLSRPASTTSKPPTVSTTSARGVPPSSSVHGMPVTGSVHGVPPPAIVPPSSSHHVGGQPGTLLGTVTTKSSDTDERHHNDRGQHASQVTCSTGKFQDTLSTSQVTNWTQQRSLGPSVTPLSLQPDSKQGVANVAAKSSQKDAHLTRVSKSEDRAAQDKLTTTASVEKTKTTSDQKEGAKSVGGRTATNVRVGEVAGITKSKWVPLGASVPKQPQNGAATAPPGAVTVQRPSEEASAAPSPGKNSATPTKVTPVQIKQLGKSLVETKTSQLLDPVEAKPLLTSLAEIKLAQRSVNETSTPGDVRAAKDAQQCSSAEKSQQPRGRGESKTEETAPVRPDTDSRSSGEAASVSDHGNTRTTKDGDERERERERERAKAGRSSSTRSSDGGHRHRSRSRSREKQKERRRSHSRDRQRRERDRRRSRSRSRGRDRERDRRATKQRSRSRSRDGKRRSRSRERQAKRRSRSRSRDRAVKRRSRSRDREAKRDRDVRRRSRSRSRERHSSFRSDRGRHERRVESEGRRSPPASRHVSREDRVSNDEVFSHSQDVDHRTTGHGDRDERYMSSIPTVGGGQVGLTDTTTSKPPEKPVMEGGQDTDERVLAAPFVGNAAKPWSGRPPPPPPPPPRDSITGNVMRATGDKDDREQWRRRGGQELFAEQQVRLDIAPGAAPRMGDSHMPPVPFARPLGDRPFMPPPPGEPMMTPPRPPPPPAWMPPMMPPRPPQMRPVGPPEQLPFPPRGPDRGWPRGPPGGRPGPW